MSILIVGGAGVIGGDAALHFRSAGEDVTIAGRKQPQAGPMTAFPFIALDYIANDVPAPVLSRFDAVVFAAGNDVRHQPKGSGDGHWQRANSQGVPRFAAAAKSAGVTTFINVGSYYPQAAPHLVDLDPYIRSRRDADDGVRALNEGTFRAISVNAPVVVGPLPGVPSRPLRVCVAYAEGRLDLPVCAPPGGTNYISTTSLTQAIDGAIKRGVGGTPYLVGDENWTYQQYFGAFFEALGKPAPPVIDQEHPLLPDSAIYGGRGSKISYEPPAAEAALLGYRRDDVRRIINEAVAEYRT